MTQRFAALSLAAFLLGCSVGQDYQTPDIMQDSRFINGDNAPLHAAATERWWRRLNDPLLTSYVERGLKSNLDIDLAFERIEEATALARATGLNAQVDGDLAAGHTRASADDGGISDNRSVSADAAYVFDIFGGIRRDRERSIAEVERATFEMGAVRLAFQAELVSSYINARYYQAAAAISRQNVNIRKQTLENVEQRRQIGEATELQLERARAELNSTQANIPVLIARFEAEVFRMATLLAESAGPLLARMQQGAGQPRGSIKSVTGVPADLLRNRPDIHAAERSLAAAVAAAGVAEANLYPSLSLGGKITAGTFDTWQFGPRLVLPLLNRGELLANKSSAEARIAQAETIWRERVLKAVEEVQVAQAFTLRWRRQIDYLTAASRSSERVVTLSRSAYDQKQIVLDDVLDAQNDFLENDLALAAAIRDQALSWVQFQVTTGRGWLPYGFEEVDDGAPERVLVTLDK